MYALEGPSWSSTTITWSFAATSGSFSGSVGAAYQATIEAAIAKWASVSNLSFREVSDVTPGVDVRIGWGVFSGGEIGETDYSYTLGATQRFVPGTTVRLEDPSADAVGTSLTSRYQGTSTTLYQVALHELGHSLGLNHSTDPNAVMFPTLGASNADLDASDIAGIQAIYGVAAGTAAPPSIVSALAATPPVAITPTTIAPIPVLPSNVTLPSGEVPVFRFFDTLTGSQFLTGDTTERDTLIQTRSDLSYEGLSMAGIDPGAGDPNAVPVYRFFETTDGTHLFTTSASEAATIRSSRPDLVAEQSSFDEHLTQQTGDTAIYRFFEKTDGTHFFTASAAERSTIVATRPDLVYEGVAFYAPALS